MSFLHLFVKANLPAGCVPECVLKHTSCFCSGVQLIHLLVKARLLELIPYGFAQPSKASQPNRFQSICASFPVRSHAKTLGYQGETRGGCKCSKTKDED